MGVFIQTITGSEVLAALTTDTTKFAGADIASIKTTAETTETRTEGEEIFSFSSFQDTAGAVDGTWTTQAEGSTYSDSLLNCDTKTQNDAICLGYMWIPEDDSYTAVLTYYEAGNKGEAHLLLNGVDKGNIDMYAGAGAANQEDTIAIGALTKGVYAVVLKISDKNGSSSDYGCSFSTLKIYRT